MKIMSNSTYYIARRELIDWQELQCAYCYRQFTRKTLALGELDHFLPVNLPSDRVFRLDNLLFTCSRCNIAKSNHVFATVAQVQDFIHAKTRFNGNRSHYTKQGYLLQRWPKNPRMPHLSPDLSAHAQMAAILQKPMPSFGLLAEADRVIIDNGARARAEIYFRAYRDELKSQFSMLIGA